jgi:pantoate--beta-alanine ligase
MKICHEKTGLLKELAHFRLKKVSVGFVPTMGALHQGHLSLVTRSKKDNDINVVSIFVNPTQFNNPSDLLHYPRTFEKDAAMLKAAGVDVLFAPSAEEMYPGDAGTPAKEEFNFGALETVMEGKFRPGHFQGVAQIVKKLFALIEPDMAYFGEKDFQQLAVIRKMTKDLRLATNIIACPTERESTGLAMSSRNMRLSEKQKSDAAIISQTLFWLREHGRDYTLTVAKSMAIKQIEKSGTLQVEYLEIAEESTLKPMNDWNDSDKPRAFAAVQAGEVRLIDNASLLPVHAEI